jgi:ribosome-associated protein
MADPQQVYAEIIEIKEEPTALYKILKIANVVSGGGEAKFAISEGYVFLNGKVETQKRKKIYAGDLICFAEKYFQIALIGKGKAATCIDQVAIKKSTDMKASKLTTRPPLCF